VTGHIDAHEIHQFQRTHRHAERHRGAIDVARVVHFLEQIAGFIHVGREQTIHKKPGAVADEDRCFAQPRHSRPRGGESLRAGASARSFDQGINAAVEEVQPTRRSG
jgi:hypothetical protein